MSFLLKFVPPQYHVAAQVAIRLGAIMILALALLALYSYGYGRGEDAVQARWDAMVVEQQLQAEQERQRQAGNIAAIDRQHTAKLSESKDEIARLRTAVAAGNVRLRVVAHCPVPAPVGSASVDHGTPDGSGAVPGSAGDAYLNRSAEPVYFALKDGIIRQTEQLKACQAILATERSP